MRKGQDFRGDRGEKTGDQRSANNFPRLSNGKKTSIHNRGTVLFTEGQPASGVYIIRSGRAKLSISSAHGQVLILRIVQEGQLIGVTSVLSGFPSEFTAETLERCQTEFIPSADFFAMQLLNKDFNEFVLRELGTEVSDSIEKLRMILLSQTAAEKLARLLLKWCDECGVSEARGVSVLNTFTHEEVAQMICTSRETVTRLLGEFSKRRLVRLTGNTILIRDRTALETIAKRKNRVDRRFGSEK